MKLLTMISLLALPLSFQATAIASSTLPSRGLLYQTDGSSSAPSITMAVIDQADDSAVRMALLFCNSGYTPLPGEGDEGTTSSGVKDFIKSECQLLPADHPRKIQGFYQSQTGAVVFAESATAAVAGQVLSDAHAWTLTPDKLALIVTTNRTSTDTQGVTTTRKNQYTLKLIARSSTIRTPALPPLLIVRGK